MTKSVYASGAIAHRETPPRWYRVVGSAGLLAGTLDAVVACFEAALQGRSPVHLFQVIAGGLLGKSSFQGGLETATVGLLLHFTIAMAWAGLFYWISRWQNKVQRHSIISGIAYGVLVYTFMYYVVLPLSAYHTKIAAPSLWTGLRDITVHIVAIGLPISLVSSRQNKVLSNSAVVCLSGCLNERGMP